MNRGRGRGVYGGGGRGVGSQQWIAKGTSSGSGGTGRSSFRQDHGSDGLNVYSESENPSGGGGSSNHMNTDDWNRKPVNGRAKNFSNERSRGNSYFPERPLHGQVRSNKDHVGQSNQGRAAPESSCRFSGSCVSTAASTGVNSSHLSDQARATVQDTQISGGQLKETVKGTSLMNERKKTANVSLSQGATGQPSNPGFISKLDEKETHATEKKLTSHVSGNVCSEPLEDTESFDICFAKSGTTVILKPSLLEKNREKRKEMKRATEGRRGEILGPGLILLKNYLSITEQVQIVNVCRRLGQGPGGFYQPGYGDRGKLHLKMMCLGKNWDPEMSQYVDVRPVDGAKPPPLPSEFSRWVRDAIYESHKLIKETEKNAKVENMLPSMSPDLCIVNFYTASGRLGLHQDRDESEESLRKCLPVVSFSIGDAAEFLYSEQKDADKADKVLLESGDVLIFGGKSRHIFHGVERILPNTAPKSLLAESDLRPGRLNLTFRQY